MVVQGSAAIQAVNAAVRTSPFMGKAPADGRKTVAFSKALNVYKDQTKKMAAVCVHAIFVEFICREAVKGGYCDRIFENT
jgi:hypothetical protein